MKLRNKMQKSLDFISFCGYLYFVPNLSQCVCGPQILVVSYGDKLQSQFNLTNLFQSFLDISPCRLQYNY